MSDDMRSGSEPRERNAASCFRRRRLFGLLAAAPLKPAPAAKQPDWTDVWRDVAGRRAVASGRWYSADGQRQVVLLLALILLPSGAAQAACPYASHTLPQLAPPSGVRGMLSGFNWSIFGSGLGPTLIKSAVGPSSITGYPDLASIPFSLRTSTSASAAARCRRSDPEAPWTTTPSRNDDNRFGGRDPENCLHLASFSIHLIWPAVRFGSKSDGDTTRKDMSAKGDRALAVIACSKILGETAASKSKFFALRSWVANSAFVARSMASPSRTLTLLVSSPWRLAPMRANWTSSPTPSATSTVPKALPHLPGIDSWGASQNARITSAIRPNMRIIAPRHPHHSQASAESSNSSSLAFFTAFFRRQSGNSPKNFWPWVVVMVAAFFAFLLLADSAVPVSPAPRIDRGRG